MSAEDNKSKRSILDDILWCSHLNDRAYDEEQIVRGVLSADGTSPRTELFAESVDDAELFPTGTTK